MEKNILVITYWPFKDALIQTYTLPYVEIIKRNLHTNSKIYLVTLDPDQKVVQSPIFHHISFQYHRFGLRAIIGHFLNLYALLRTIRKKKIDVIHAWCTPAGGIGYILNKLTGKKLIIDSFEPHAEPMVESGTWSKSGLAFKILFWMEKMQSRTAKAAIACVPEMQDYALAKYGKCPDEFYAKPACVNMQLFSIEKEKSRELRDLYGINEEIVCVYAGKFGGSYLTTEVFDFFSVASKHWKGCFKVLLLNNHPTEQIQEWCWKSDFDYNLVVQDFVPHHEVPKYIGLADFAITPFVPVPSKRFGTPIKTGEYWAMGLPVVITKDISDNSEIIANEKIGAVLEDLSAKSYHDAVKLIDDLLCEDRDALIEKIRAVASKYRDFSIAENVYSRLYRSE